MCKHENAKRVAKDFALFHCYECDSYIVIDEKK